MGEAQFSHQSLRFSFAGEPFHKTAFGVTNPKLVVIDMSNGLLCDAWLQGRLKMSGTYLESDLSAHERA